MKALGIVRKMDHLGRVVIPKEVRKSQGWKDGQPMEMFMDGDNLVMKACGKDQERQEAIESLNVIKEIVGDDVVVDEMLSNLRKYLKG